MITAEAIFLFAALVFFVLAAIRMTSPRVDLLGAGLAFLTAALLYPLVV